MASAPITFGDEGPTPNLDGTPHPVLTRQLSSPSKAGFDGNAALSLRLSKIIGTTTLNSFAFAFNAERSSFITCAGSIAVWNEIDPNLNVLQRFYKAHPSATVQPPLIEPGTPTKVDRRKSQLSPIRAGTFGIRSAVTPASPAAPASPSTPNKSGARQGSRSAACVSVSQDGRVLAVGEIGYNPQIYLFSTIGENTAPLAVLSDHSYGVRCVALSHDARWLASVGDVHDGYIFVWALGTRIASPKLQGSNKCTTIINAMTWMGNSIVTVGVRHVKVWRPDLSKVPSPAKSKLKLGFKDAVPASPSSKALNGRNCILGPLVESEFTCIAAVSDTMAVVGTNTGHICILDDRAGNQTLVIARRASSFITSIHMDHNDQRAWVGGSNGYVQSFAITDLEAVRSKSVTSSTSGSPRSVTREVLSGDVVGLGVLKHCVVTVDSTRYIRMLHRDTLAAAHAPLKVIPSHQRAVLGVMVVQMLEPSEKSFLTYDATGEVMCWDFEGRFQANYQIPVEQLLYDEGVELNELTVAKLSLSKKFVLAGDKYGMLRLIRRSPWVSGVAVRTHQGEMNCMDLCQLEDGTELIATGGRDRAVQLHLIKDDAVELFQTIEQHSASVSGLLFKNDGSYLFSSSLDRTIGVFALATTESSRAYLPLRILTLKQSPVALSLSYHQDHQLLVSTADKQLHDFDVNLGQCLSSVKTSDERNNNPVLLSNIIDRTYQAAAVKRHMLIGVSSTDKTVRVHDADSGASLAQEFAHSESASGIEVIEEGGADDIDGLRLVSTGLDGTVLLWDLRSAERGSDQSATSSPVLESPVVAHPLRRVLSKSAFADFSRSLEADGRSPIPPATPSRGTSPTRARSRVSAVGTPTASPKFQAPRLSRVDQSPPPSLSNTPTRPRRRPPIRTKSYESLESLDSVAEQLSLSLKHFRKRVEQSSMGLSDSVARELGTQLNAALEVIGESNKRKEGGSSRNEVTGLLDHYASRLAHLVEQKVALGTSAMKNDQPHIDEANETK